MDPVQFNLKEGQALLIKVCDGVLVGDFFIGESLTGVVTCPAGASLAVNPVEVP